jgi:hypothetical protein
MQAGDGEQVDRARRQERIDLIPRQAFPAAEQEGRRQRQLGRGDVSGQRVGRPPPHPLDSGGHGRSERADHTS